KLNDREAYEALRERKRDRQRAWWADLKLNDREAYEALRERKRDYCGAWYADLQANDQEAYEALLERKRKADAVHYAAAQAAMAYQCNQNVYHQTTHIWKCGDNCAYLGTSKELLATKAVPPVLSSQPNVILPVAHTRETRSSSRRAAKAVKRPVQDQEGEMGDVEMGDVEMGDVEMGDVEMGDVEMGEISVDLLSRPRSLSTSPASSDECPSPPSKRRRIGVVEEKKEIADNKAIELKTNQERIRYLPRSRPLTFPPLFSSVQIVPFVPHPPVPSTRCLTSIEGIAPPHYFA
ncbi:hypothetical protein JCM5353_002782, partial [Sporobolomyces roseus]